MKAKELAEIGQRLKQVRKYLDIQQNTMADNLGITAAYLSEIEKGKSTPSGELFLKITKTYNISLEYLFLGRGDMIYPSKPNESFTFDPDIDSIEKLTWMMRKSKYFNSLILNTAQRLMLEQEEVIIKSLSISEKPKKKESSTSRP